VRAISGIVVSLASPWSPANKSETTPSVLDDRLEGTLSSPCVQQLARPSRAPEWGQRIKIEVDGIEVTAQPPMLFYRLTMSPPGSSTATHHLMKRFLDFQDFQGALQRELSGRPEFRVPPLPVARSESDTMTAEFQASLNAYLIVLTRNPDVVETYTFRNFFQLTEEYRQAYDDMPRDAGCGANEEQEPWEEARGAEGENSRLLLAAGSWPPSPAKEKGIEELAPLRKTESPALLDCGPPLSPLLGGPPPAAEEDAIAATEMAAASSDAQALAPSPLGDEGASLLTFHAATILESCKRIHQDIVAKGPTATPSASPASSTGSCAGSAPPELLDETPGARAVRLLGVPAPPEAITGGSLNVPFLRRFSDCYRSETPCPARAPATAGDAAARTYVRSSSCEPLRPQKAFVVEPRQHYPGVPQLVEGHGQASCSRPPRATPTGLEATVPKKRPQESGLGRGAAGTPTEADVEQLRRDLPSPKGPAITSALPLDKVTSSKEALRELISAPPPRKTHEQVRLDWPSERNIEESSDDLLPHSKTNEDLQEIKRRVDFDVSGAAKAATVLDGGAGFASRRTMLDSPTASPRRASRNGRERSLCVVCMSSPQEMAIDPCGHLSMCHACLSTVGACPVCRGPIAKALRVYFA
jgi:hypothetical protein